MTKYFIRCNYTHPDSAHRWWLRKDQYTIGDLFVDEQTAQWIADQLQRAHEEEQATRHNLSGCICVDFLNDNPDPVPNPDCSIHGAGFRAL